MSVDWLDMHWHWPTWPGSAPVACGDPDTEACTDPGCSLHSGTTGFLNQAGGEVSLDANDPENQVLAAACVIRHAKSEADAEVLLEMLDLGSPDDELQVIAMIGALR